MCRSWRRRELTRAGLIVAAAAAVVVAAAAVWASSWQSNYLRDSVPWRAQFGFAVLQGSASTPHQLFAALAEAL